MLLEVELAEGVFLADVGFGLMTLTAPLRTEAGLEQETPHGTFRLAEVDGELQLQALRGDDWSPVYQAALTPLEAADIEMMNWFTATHPASPFTSMLMAARVAGDTRLGLAGNVLSAHGPAGSERRKLETARGTGRRSHRGFRHRPARGKPGPAGADRGGRPSRPARAGALRAP